MEFDKEVEDVSNHYQVFAENRNNAQADYEDHIEVIEDRYTVVGLLYIGVCICLIVLLVLAHIINLDALQHYFLWNTVVIIAGNFALMVITFVFGSRKRIQKIGARVYSENESSEELNLRLDNEVKRRKKGMNFFFGLWTTISVIIVGCVTVLYVFLCKNAYSENFLYSPEILGTFSGSNENWEYTCEILSCDENGNVEMIVEMEFKGTKYAKIKQKGAITRKDTTVIVVESDEAEIIYSTNGVRINPCEVHFLGFYKNYNEARIYHSDWIPLCRQCDSFDAPDLEK